jgi:hypothetical protein
MENRWFIPKVVEEWRERVNREEVGRERANWPPRNEVEAAEVLVSLVKGESAREEAMAAIAISRLQNAKPWHHSSKRSAEKRIALTPTRMNVLPDDDG